MLDEKELIKWEIKKKAFLYHSTNEWISLNSNIKKQLKLNITQEEKVKI